MHVTRPDLQSLHGLWRIWFDLGATQQYYPLLHSAFWIEHHLWGDAVLGYHLINVAFHALSAFLVVLLVRRLGLPGAWFAAFAVLLNWLHKTDCGSAFGWHGLQHLRNDCTRWRASEAFAFLAAVFWFASFVLVRQLGRLGLQ